MSTQSANWRRTDWLWLALLGLLFQAIWLVQMPTPTYMDAYYYTSNGQRLAAGDGFTELVIWQYLDDPAGVPTPSHSYWMPLTSILAAAGYSLGGGFWAAQLPFWLLAGLLPLLAYWISLQFFSERWQMWTAVLLTISGGFYTRFLNQPSTFVPFAWAGGLCLLFLSFTQQRPAKKWWFLAGLTAGLAHLTRADGALLLIVGGLLWLWQIFSPQSARSAQRKERKISVSSVLSVVNLILGYLLVMTPWFIRNWRLFGRPLPTSGTQTIFLTTYDDLFAYGRSFDLTHFLEWGWGNILQSKLDGLLLAGGTFIAVCGLVFLTPLVVWGWWKWWRDEEKRPYLRPMSWYALLLFASMSLVFTLPGGRGGLLHSSVALWPWLMVLATAGLGYAVEWMATKLPHWEPQTAKPRFAALFVIVAFAISATLFYARADSGLEAEVYADVGAMLPEMAVLMAGNAPGVYYHTGLPALSIPNEPIAIVQEAATRYGVTHLLLDVDHPQPLDELYVQQTSQPGFTLLFVRDGYQLYELTP
ncbi:glycosyltransferase family 39 protein [Candidatus Leptofilum sp.]|uniref:glycosyltransferase family 39 protein n=1 Tax=Candidatus Leptofilum sp. TaxID=3241576 RepID=UPI003B58E870